MINTAMNIGQTEIVYLNGTPSLLFDKPKTLLKRRILE